ncbi:MAG: glycosyltransferase family 9 protein, partial [Phycicoccus sp.]
MRPVDVFVLRALGLGDMLTGVPALRALRRALPDARLHLAAPAHLGRFLERRGVVDAVLPLDGLDARPLDGLDARVPPPAGLGAPAPPLDGFDGLDARVPPPAGLGAPAPP